MLQIYNDVFCDAVKYRVFTGINVAYIVCEQYEDFKKSEFIS